MRRMKRSFIIFVLVLFCAQIAAAGENRFVVQADKKVMLDTKNALMWPLQDNDSDISWYAGQEYCEGFKQGGFTDWRMPTREELASLYELEAANSTDYYIVPLVKISACCLWAIDTSKARVGSFDFEYGNKDWGYPMSTVDARILPVRTAQ